MYNLLKVSSGPVLFLALFIFNMVRTLWNDHDSRRAAEEAAFAMTPWQFSVCTLRHCKSQGLSNPMVFFSMTLTFLGWADKLFKRYFTLMSLKVNCLAVSSHMVCCFPSQLCIRVNLLSICPTILCMNPAAFDVCISLFHFAPCIFSVQPHLACFHYSFMTYHPCLFSIKKWGDILPRRLAALLDSEPRCYSYLKDGGGSCGKKQTKESGGSKASASEADLAALQPVKA